MLSVTDSRHDPTGPRSGSSKRGETVPRVGRTLRRGRGGVVDECPIITGTESGERRRGSEGTQKE